MPNLRKKAKLASILKKLNGVKDINDPIINDIIQELEDIRASIPQEKDLSPYFKDISVLQNNHQNLSRIIENLSKSVDSQTAILQNNTKAVDQQMKNVSEKLESALGKFSKDIKEAKIDMLRNVASVSNVSSPRRGGSHAQRRIAIEGSLLSEKYTDVNFKGTGVTFASTDNNNAKRVDLTFQADNDSATWGNVTGTLSNQTDLQTALNTKVDEVASTDNAIVRFDGTGGAVQDSTAVIADTGGITITNPAGGYAPANYLNIKGSLVDNLNYPGLQFTGGTLTTSYPRIGLNNGGYGFFMTGGASAVIPNAVSYVVDSVGGSTLTAGSTDLLKVSATGNSLLLGYSRVGGTTAPTNTSAGDFTAVRIFVDDDAYAAGWNGSVKVPTQNAVYDKIETIVSNVTHTGEVTGATALTVDKTAITGKTLVTAVGTDYVLISDTSDGGNLKKALASDLAGAGGSGITRSINSISAPQSAGATALTDYIYLISGTTTLTLPTAVGNTNRYTIKNVGVNTVTIDTTAAQTIDDSATASLPVANTSIDIISNNSNWVII